MIEDLDFETYLKISPNEFEIFLFDIKNSKNLYENKLVIEKNKNFINLSILDNFLEHNIFKIEKLIGKFIKNIFVIIENNKILKTKIGIKKKDFHSYIDQEYLKIYLSEAKDIFKQNYQDEKIMHIIINKYLIDGVIHSKMSQNIKCSQLCLEIEFRSISNNLINDLSAVLKKYHIKIIKYLDASYVKNSFVDPNISFIKMVTLIKNGHNQNEVMLIPKNVKKQGFFEKFFQLFS